MLNHEILSIIERASQPGIGDTLLAAEEACQLMDSFVNTCSDAIAYTENSINTLINQVFSLEEIKKFDNTNLPYLFGILLMHSSAVSKINPLISLEYSAAGEENNVNMQFLELTLQDASNLHICVLEEVAKSKLDGEGGLRND